MIINVRGPSGSGKTHVVREVMKYFTCQAVHEDGRRQPIGYNLQDFSGSGQSCFVPGHYESACGGVDTIPTYAKLFGLIEEWARFTSVLYEGLLVSEDTKQLMQLIGHVHPTPVHVILLSTPLAECFERIESRRSASGRGSLKEANLEKRGQKWRDCRNCVHKLKTRLGPEYNNVHHYECTSEEAIKLVKELLGV